MRSQGQTEKKISSPRDDGRAGVIRVRVLSIEHVTHLSPQVLPRAHRHGHLTHGSAAARVLHARARRSEDLHKMPNGEFSFCSLFRLCANWTSLSPISHPSSHSLTRRDTSSLDAHARATSSLFYRRRAKRVVSRQRSTRRVRVARETPRFQCATGKPRKSSRRSRQGLRCHALTPRTAHTKSQLKPPKVRNRDERYYNRRPIIPLHRPRLRHQRREVHGDRWNRRCHHGNFSQVPSHR